jgi:lysophospholipase L1-like esterase
MSNGLQGPALDAQSRNQARPLRYAALGDSYTIGTAVAEAERWPDQLVAVETRLELVANLGVNGFTSHDVIAQELPQLEALEPEFATILVGVNDVVQRLPPTLYRENVGRILDDLIARVGHGRVLAITTPDHTVTPSGTQYGDPARQAEAIRTINELLVHEAAGRLVRVVDVHDISLRAADEPSLVAHDGLHPSAEQYVLWVARIYPAVRAMLAE